MNTVYWIGADGNVWFRSGDNVQNAGKLIKDYGNGFDAQYLSAESERIDDPNPPKESAPSVTTTDGSGTQKVLNQAAIDNTQKAVGSLDDELGIGYKNIDDNFASLIGGYDSERGRTEGEYNEGKVTNTQNLQKNKQNALVTAAQGLRGLRGVLGSIGALSGDGQTLANRAVTAEANADIGGATDTFAGNAQNLDKAWDRFDEEDERRRAEARTAKTNQRTALEGSIASKRQNFFQKLAELYGEVDDTGNATNWLNKAGDLNSVIAQKSRVQSTPFQKRGAAFTPGELENYLAGAGDRTVEVRRGGTEGELAGDGLLAGISQKEDENEKRRRFAVA